MKYKVRNWRDEFVIDASDIQDAVDKVIEYYACYDVDVYFYDGCADIYFDCKLGPNISPM